MSRTDKTKPMWVKLAHRDVAVVEKHDHRAGPCDLPDPFDHVAFTRLTTRCRREFLDTGTRVCCCPMCHAWDYPDRTEPQRRRRERRKSKMADRAWAQNYDN
ncbi:hypothetical protein F0Q45_21760 [Mycobacterium simiae]|uniref:Uncharacterized protein n=1 Tax=Mycobacterium simiae TaxID=1784 RepID=A0A5B1BLX9_MYCSI|nr:hypothetical protein [Mycobacterium simiae]KAA1248224.1 hypothetical protein F0Q45_21760 [Mycobacterium simiae]